MRFNKTVQFYTVTSSLDALNRPQETEALGAEVPCVEDRVGFTVAFQAMQAGLMASVRLKLRNALYNGQTHFLYGGVRYRIITTQKEVNGFLTIVGETI